MERLTEEMSHHSPDQPQAGCNATSKSPERVINEVPCKPIVQLQREIMLLLEKNLVVNIGILAVVGQMD